MRAGFDIRPAVTAFGTVHHRIPVDIDVRDGDADDLAKLASIDVANLGSSRTTDLNHLLDGGHQLRVAANGYAVRDDHAVLTVSATDTTSACALLADALNLLLGRGEIRVPRVTAEQQWAITAAVQAGLYVRPWGPLLTRGTRIPAASYLPHPALC